MRAMSRDQLVQENTCGSRWCSSTLITWTKKLDYEERQLFPQIFVLGRNPGNPGSFLAGTAEQRHACRARKTQREFRSRQNRISADRGARHTPLRDLPRSGQLQGDTQEMRNLSHAG